MCENSQKLELLEAECRNYKEREANLKQLNDSIMLAFNDLTLEAEKNTKVSKKNFFFLIISFPKENCQ